MTLQRIMTDTHTRRHWLKATGTVTAALGAGWTGAAWAAPEGDEGPFVTAPPNSVGPGKKFAATGQAQVYPGYTLICHVARPGAAFEALCDARDELRQQPVHRRKLTWMPEQSYHMTVCDLINVGHKRTGGDWPAGVPADAPLDAAGEHIARILRKFDLGALPPYRMVVDEAEMEQAVLPNGALRTGVPWRPIDAAERERLYDLRDRVFSAIGIRHAGHDAYRFHTTLAYPIERLTATEAKDYGRAFTQAMRRLREKVPVMTFGAPEFCRFESMYLFVPQFDLQPQPRR